MNTEDRSDIESVLTVLHYLREHETDSGHVFQLAKAYGAVLYKHGDIVTHQDTTPSKEDVETALSLLDEYGEECGGLDDEWTMVNDLNEARNTIELESMEGTPRPLADIMHE